MNESMSMAGLLERHYPVTVVIDRIWREHRQWSYQDWVVSGVIPEEPHNDEENVPVSQVQRFADDSGAEHYIWKGMQLSLYRDGLTSYFHNLQSEQPFLFVLCRDDDEQKGLVPVAVSANFADAEAHMETEGTVLTTPLCHPFDKYLADYVLHNKMYLEKQARQSGKRKRNKDSGRS
jgi:hypothetical protein